MFERRRFIAGLAAGSACMLFPVFSTPVFAQNGVESAWERIQRTKTIRMGAITGAAPYYHKDLRSREWEGFMIDFAHDLSSKLGVEPVFSEVNWGTYVMELQSNRLDIFLGVNPTPERREALDITNPLFNNAFVLMAREGFAPQTWEEINRPEFRLAVDMGSSHDQFIQQVCPNATILRLNSAADASMAVVSGRADAQVLAIVLALRLRSQNPNFKNLVLPHPVQTTTTNIGLRKEDDKRLLAYVNDWIAEIRASGFVQQTVMANLEKFSGVTATDLPPEVSF